MSLVAFQVVDDLVPSQAVSRCNANYELPLPAMLASIVRFCAEASSRDMTIPVIHKGN